MTNARKQQARQSKAMISTCKSSANITRSWLALLLCASITLFGCHAQLVLAANSQQQFSVDQATNVISMLIKANQASACDGEQLAIRCNDDYVIEIMTAELTVLAAEHHEHLQTTFNRDLEPNGFICPPLPSDQQAQLKQQLTKPNSSEAACSEEAAHELSSSNQLKFMSLVRKQCSLLNSCTLDFRIATTTSSNQTLGSGDFGLELARLVSDKCHLNRKLIELAYKCRPSKVKSRAACRNSRLMLECAPGETNKRLAIGSAVYGFWNDDKKTHEKCLLEEERQLKTLDSSVASQQQQQQLVASPLQARNCSSQGPQALNVIANECLFKHQCQLQLKPQLFRGSEQSAISSTCPSNQLEYLRVIYVCISEDLLITTNSSQWRHQSASAKTNEQQQIATTTQQPPFSSLKSLMSAVRSNNSHVTITFVSSSSASDSKLEFSTIPSKPRLQSTSPRSEHEEIGGRVYAVLAADPQLSTVPPSQWSTSQRVKFVLLRYQTQLIVCLSLITLATFALMALLILLCHSSSRNSTTSNASSAKSSKSFGLSSTSSTTTGSGGAQNVYCNSRLTVATVMAKSQQLMSAHVKLNSEKHKHNLGHKTRPTNSCSESCFSHEHDEDNNFSTSTTNQKRQRPRPPPLQAPQLFAHTHASDSSLSPLPEHNNNSPALMSRYTTPPLSAASREHPATAACSSNNNFWPAPDEQQEQPPTFWSFNGDQQQQSQISTGSLRLSSTASRGHLQQQFGAATMRPMGQRTFGAGPAPQLVRDFACLQQQPPPSQNIDCTHSMASNQPSNWCPI